MKIVIKNPSPLGPDLAKWGDFHFGGSLARALEARGAEVVQHFWPEWDRDDAPDLVLVLRGKRRWKGAPGGALTLMWVISHPGAVSGDEMAAFDAVLVASETHWRMLREAPGIVVDLARQCADTTLFARTNDAAADARRRGIRFVGNSRGVRRDILRWARDSGAPVEIVGRHWDKLGFADLVASDYVANDRLPAFYRATKLSLNDHWGDMRHFGYVSNRVFDCLACGTPVLSDAFPELRTLCGDGLLYATDSESFLRALTRYYVAYDELLGNAARAWDRLGPDHSFDARAAQILAWAAAPGARGVREVPAPALPSPLAPMVDAAVARLRAAGVGGAIPILHLCPTPAGVAYLFGRDDLNYLSGGIGDGPWQLALDPAMSAVVDGRFALIVIEDGDPVAGLAPARRADLFGALRRTAKRVSLAVAPGGLAQDLSPRFARNADEGPDGRYTIVELMEN